MSGAETPAAVPAKEDPEALVLRGKPRPAVRFRRKLIVGLAAAAAAGLVALSWLALEPPSFRKAVSIEGEEPAGKAGRDALANAPSSYGDVPPLGPPLPGDLGRPILERQREYGTASEPAEGSSQFDRAEAAAEAERQRAAAELQAARSSPVTVQLVGAKAESDVAARPAAPGDPPQQSAAVPASPQRKFDFARSSGGNANPHGLTPAPSAWMLSAGTVIPASLVTGLNSDLPGTVVAQVTGNVRDSATGRAVLVPQGARLLGTYDNVVAYGQRRALVVWKRIVFPDGSSVELDNVPATDASGYSGFADGVDAHSLRLLKGIALSTLLGVGTQLGLGGSESGLVRAIRQSAEQGAAHAGDQITSRNLDVQPTITIRPGWPVRALLNKDLILRPWTQ